MYWPVAKRVFEIYLVSVFRSTNEIIALAMIFNIAKKEVGLKDISRSLQKYEMKSGILKMRI